MAQMPVSRGARRRFLQQMSFVAAASLVAPRFTFGQARELVADTTLGKVRGLTIDGVHSFRGIPYGGDTAGKNRFMPPTRPRPWTGVRDCTDWGHIAPRPVSSNPPSEYTLAVGWNNNRGGLSEDCLNVNVWTRALRDGGNRAVMVCFHGGGYTSGSANLVALEGQHLVRTGDVVVVNVNHRLGALGYLDLSAFGGPELKSSANVGMLDCVAALEWVRDNIASFGGNPNNVMIFGQSGGGGKCSTLMVMPAAKGLFHRVALQSGSTLRSGRHETAQRAAETLWTKLGVAKGDLAKLQAIPFEQVVAAQQNTGPVMDGVVVPRDPFDPDAPAISSHVPMIIGTCLEDSSYNINAPVADDAELLAWVETQAAGKSAEIVAAYRAIYPKKTAFMLRGMIATDRAGRRNAVTQAERKAAQAVAPAFMYRWDWPAPAANGRWGATHGTDLSPSFANPATPMSMNTPEAQVMARRIGSAFIAFAKSGKPDNPEIPHWPAYDTASRSVMIFDSQTRVDADPNRELRQLWDRLLT
jgi:para-nitrobenzyl esterase